MDAILKFLGILVLGSIALGVLAAMGPLGALIVFFIIGGLIAGKL